MRSAARKGESGYTLIELLIVSVVLGILASIAIVSLLNALDKAKQRATMGDMRTISRAIEAYMIANTQPPADGSTMADLATILRPYYASVVPTADHWRNGYGYSADSDGNYTLESFGRDGVDGDDMTVDSRFDFDLDIVIVNGNFIAAPE